MIGPVADGGGLVAALARDSSGVRSRLDAALLQQSSGKVAQSYGGLGAASRTSLDLRPALENTRTWQTNIERAAGRLDATQAAMTRISGIAADFFAKTNDVNHFGTSEAASIAAAARQALEQVAQALNTRSGDVYVFAGRDTGTAPVPNTDPAVVGAALLASDTAAPPFSGSIGTAVPEVEVGEGQRVQVGLLANQNTLAVSAAPTTGSYMRDVMRALANLAGISDTPGVEVAVADVRTRLSSAIGAMATETGALGDLQKGLATRKVQLAASETALTKQVSNVEDVDMAATLVRVSALQTQLQASYQVIAGARELSLTKFI